MGAWGFGPLDSDQGLDWLIDPATQAVLRIRELCERAEGKEADYGHELRAATVLWHALEPYSHSRFDDTDEKLKMRLEALLADDDWINSWNEPDTVRVLLREEIASVS